MNWGKNIPLIVGVSLPVLMIVFIAVSIYIPGIFIQPKYNFLYTNSNNYNNRYFVKKDHLEINPNFRNEYSYTYVETKIFIHDIRSNKSREIQYAEAQKLILDSNNISPDGFKITSGGRSGGFFPFYFYSDSYYGDKYLSNGTVNKKLDLNITDGYYNFSFLGWIIN